MWFLDTRAESSPLAFEELDLTFVFFCLFPGIERAKVFAFAGFRIDLSRIEPVFTRFQFPDHYISPVQVRKVGIKLRQYSL